MKGIFVHPCKILIVDDAKEIRDLLACLLHQEGFETLEANCGESALKLMRQVFPDVVILDVHLPDIDGLTVLREIRKLDGCVPVVMVTACGDISSVVEAMKNGASDYVTKPFSNTELVLTLRRAIEGGHRRPDLPSARTPNERCASLPELMGPSSAVRQLVADVERVASTDFTVILSGETGSGKEVVARTIHGRSRRAQGPFVSVDCGAIQPGLIENELFGHEKGAFTGADHSQPGKFEAAAGGTLFLDEIQNLPLAVQTKLLRALQEKQICRVGGTRYLDNDLRVLAATNQDLPAQVRAGQFRQDLYHRLNEFGIALPPLRQRRDDILYLARRFIHLTCQELQKEVEQISPEAVDILLHYQWPGNVRELRNVIRRAVLLADGRIGPEHVGLTVRKTEEEPNAAWTGGFPEQPVPLRELVRRYAEEKEREILALVLRRTGGNKAMAARLLQVDYKTIRTKTRQYGISITFIGDENHEE